MLSIRAHFGTVAVGMPVTRTPRTDPGVRYSRTGLLSGTRFRDSGFGMLLFPQGGWLVLLQPDSVRYEFPLKAAYHCQPLPLELRGQACP
jgi:hypothetical protein